MVRALSVGTVNFTSISISWQMLDCPLQNGEITQYSIIYAETVPSRQAGSATVANNVLQYTTNSLYPGTTYIFQVAARNNMGLGPYASIEISTPQPTGKHNPNL